MINTNPYRLLIIHESKIPFARSDVICFQNNLQNHDASNLVTNRYT